MRTHLYLLLCCLPLASWGQAGPEADPAAYRASRDLTAEANKELAEDKFPDAEANYRRAIAKSDRNTVAPYNLGNAYYRDESYGEAFGRFREAGEKTTEKPNKHKAYHNMGNVFMKQKDYQQAIDAYKEALRNDPTDEETRYNLALAKELLKKDPQQQQDNQNDEQQQDQEEQQEQNQDQGENEENQDNQQEQDQQQDGGESEQEENKEGDGDRKEEQDRNPEQQEEQQQQQRPNQLSPQQIQNLLQAMENEEKKVKEKIDAQKVKGPQVKTEKDW